MEPLLYHWRCWLPSFLILFSVYSAVSLWLCWGILISFFLLPQIGMAQPENALTGRCHPVTTNLFYTSVRNSLPKVVSLAAFSKCAILIHLYDIQPKMTFHCPVLGAVVVVSDVPPASVYPIIPYGYYILLVHINLYQLLFSLCWSCRCALDEKELILWTFNFTLSLS